ncbi:MAG: 50S ribosomal protein L29 [Actinomycetota bacterium]|nr:50S ribosomal protein L29 [Actinomycetota bacterium]
MVKTSDLSETSIDQLETQLAETKAELFNLRFQHVTGKLDNYARIGQVRRDVARIMTILRAREIALAEGDESR